MRSTDVKQVSGSSRKMRESQPDVPPLFRFDPEENFKLWMQVCFPNSSLAREDAIWVWLTTPLEERVQRSRNDRPESAKSHGVEIAGAAPQKATESARSKQTGPGNSNGGVSGKPGLMDGDEEERFAGRSSFWKRDNSRLLRRFAKYSVLGLLTVAIFWVTLTSKVASPTNAASAAAKTVKAQAATVAGVSSPQRQESVEKRYDFAPAPMTIENVSVGCEDTQPCIEIKTRGQGALPKLSKLSNPDRVVMDFQDAVSSFDIHRIAVRRGSVKAVRIGEDAAQPPRTRLVIDLVEKCDYELNTLTNGVVLKLLPKATPRQGG